MNFFKIIVISALFILLSKVSMADSHDNQQNIIDKAKEINKKIKEKQANSKKNISSEINDEEPLPLNDPFVGDSSLSGGTTIMANNSEEAQNEMSLYKFKLVGIMTSENDDGFVTYTLEVHPDDKGRVIGRQGRVAQAIRSLLRVAAVKNGIHVSLEIE